MNKSKIKQLLNDSSKGLTSDLTKLQQMLKDNGIDATQEEIKEVRNSLPWHQLTNVPKKEKKFNTIVVADNKDLYYMDVMVYNRFKIHGYQYILNVVDTNSRYVSSRALTNMKLKESTRGNKDFTLMDAIEDIMKEMGYPKVMRCDNQFISDDFVKLMKDNDVKVIYSEPDDKIKNALVESFNRTLANLLQKWRISSKRHDWYKVLPEIIKKYNNNVHSTIKAKSIDVWNYKDTNKQKITIIKPSFKINDKVRTVTNKKLFQKGDAIRNSKAIYMIVEIINNKYKLQNLETKDILNKLYGPRNLVKVTDVDEINEVIDEPAEATKIAEPVKFITPVRSRKDRKINKPSEPVKFIGSTPVKSRLKKNNLL